MQVCLVENFFEMQLMLVLKHVFHNHSTSAKDAASDGDTFLGWMMLDVVWALVSVASTIVFVSTRRVFVAFIAEVSVRPASERGHVATEVALVLDVAETVLSTHELL